MDFMWFGDYFSKNTNRLVFEMKKDFCAVGNGILNVIYIIFIFEGLSLFRIF
jgi:hypothetical protein